MTHKETIDKICESKSIDQIQQIVDAMIEDRLSVIHDDFSQERNDKLHQLNVDIAEYSTALFMKRKAAKLGNRPTKELPAKGNLRISETEEIDYFGMIDNGKGLEVIDDDGKKCYRPDGSVVMGQDADQLWGIKTLFVNPGSNMGVVVKTDVGNVTSKLYSVVMERIDKYMGVNLFTIHPEDPSKLVSFAHYADKTGDPNQFNHRINAMYLDLHTKMLDPLPCTLDFDKYTEKFGRD